MKYCKGNCGETLGIFQGDYCKDCYEKLSLREKFIHDMKFKQMYKY